MAKLSTFKLTFCLIVEDFTKWLADQVFSPTIIVIYSHHMNLGGYLPIADNVFLAICRRWISVVFPAAPQFPAVSPRKALATKERPVRTGDSHGNNLGRTSRFLCWRQYGRDQS